jgi:hypothetical protein
MDGSRYDDLCSRPWYTCDGCNEGLDGDTYANLMDDETDEEDVDLEDDEEDDDFEDETDEEGDEADEEEDEKD